MEGIFNNQVTRVYARVHSLHAISRPSDFAQTITHERKKRQNVCFNKMSRTVPVRTAALTGKSVLYVTARSNFATTHSPVLKWNFEVRTNRTPSLPASTDCYFRVQEIQKFSRYNRRIIRFTMQYIQHLFSLKLKSCRQREWKKCRR